MLEAIKQKLEDGIKKDSLIKVFKDSYYNNNLEAIKYILEYHGEDIALGENLYEVFLDAVNAQRVEVVIYIIKNYMRREDLNRLNEIVELKSLEPLSKKSLTITILLMQIEMMLLNAQSTVQNNNNVLFKALRKHNIPLDLSQNNILKQIRSFLKLKGRDQEFIAQFETGYCHGISSLWLYAKWLQNQPRKTFIDRDDYTWFEYVIKLLALQQVNATEFNKEEDKEIERFIQHIEFFQNIKKYLSSHNPGDLHNSLQDTYADRKLKQDYSFASLLTLTQLQTLLKEPGFIQEDKQVLIVSHNHTVALFKRNGVFYCFDPNSSSGEIIGIAADKVAKWIFASNLAPDKAILPLGFIMFSFDGMLANYPNKTELLKKLNPAIEPSTTIYDKCSSLHMAASIGDLESVEYFLQMGANPCHTLLNGTTALMLAAQNGYSEVVAKLLAIENIDVNQARTDGTTALMLAAQHGHIEVVAKLLTAEKLDVNQANSDGATALMLAAQDGHSGVVAKLLAAKNIDVNQADSDGTTALMLAAQDGHSEVVAKLLAAKNIDVNQADSDGATALMLAAQDGHSEVVAKLLAAEKLDVNQADSDGTTALMLAAYNGHSEVVAKLLTAEKLDVNQADSDGATALMFAAYNGHSEVVAKLLTAEKLDVNQADSDGATALMLAAQNGHSEAVAQLLTAENIDVNQVSSVGTTALMLAAQYGHSGVVAKLLAAKNIDINHARAGGTTALMFAAQNGHSEVVAKLLAAKNLEVNQVGPSGATALMLAAQNGHSEAVAQLLTAENIDVNQVSSGGTTALMFAAQNGHLNVVTELLATEGIDIDKINKNGMTAVMLARQNGYTEVVNELVAFKNNLQVNVYRAL